MYFVVAVVVLLALAVAALLVVYLVSAVQGEACNPLALRSSNNGRAAKGNAPRFVGQGVTRRHGLDPLLLTCQPAGPLA